MPSRALSDWQTVRAVALDEIASAHRSVGGAGPGRRFATQQINQAYAVLLAAQFQGFCRDLHTEAARALTAAVTPDAVGDIYFVDLLRNRTLDRGNPNPGNIGADFNRLGTPFWPDVLAYDSRNERRRNQLEDLNRWRNAIAHQHFDPAVLGGRVTLSLARVRRWRSVCDRLAESFDAVLERRIRELIGRSPW